MPRVSVLLPVYNCRRYLAAAVDSIRAQTFTDFEFIVVDDGSTDGSAAMLEAAAAHEPRLRVIRRPNTGIVGALNDGLAGATGEFVARMDGDDVALPGRLAAQVAFLGRNPDIVAVGTAAWMTDASGAVVDLYRPPVDHAGIEAELLRGNGGALLHPTVCLRRTALEQAGRYDPAFDKAEDLDLFFRLGALGRLANLPAPLLRYRLHPQSTNFSSRTRQKELVARLLERERPRRGLSAVAPGGPVGHSDLAPAALRRRWACTAAQHGTARTALRHAAAALALAPFRRISWSTLHYVLTCLRSRPTLPSSP